MFIPAMLASPLPAAARVAPDALAAGAAGVEGLAPEEKE